MSIIFVTWAVVAMLNLHAAAWATNAKARLNAHDYRRGGTRRRLRSAVRTGTVTFYLTALVYIGLTAWNAHDHVRQVPAEVGARIFLQYELLTVIVGTLVWFVYVCATLVRRKQGDAIAWPFVVWPKRNMA